VLLSFSSDKGKETVLLYCQGTWDTDIMSKEETPHPMYKTETQTFSASLPVHSLLILSDLKDVTYCSKG